MMRTIAVALAIGGCTTAVYPEGEPVEEPGQLELTWRVGTTDCSEAGLDQVVVYLDGEEVASFPCSDGYGEVGRLAPGRYMSRLIGRDVRGFARYDAVPGEVDVASGVATALPTAVLGALPGDIVVTWYFDNGRLCGANGVTEVEATLFDDAYVVDSQVLECESGILSFQAIRAGDYQVHVMGRDPDGAALFDGVADLQLEKGGRTELEVMLETF